jgi:hypothetical protein
MIADKVKRQTSEFNFVSNKIRAKPSYISNFNFFTLSLTSSSKSKQITNPTGAAGNPVVKSRKYQQQSQRNS